MEDEVERESESQALLERMRNLKSKMRKIEEEKKDNDEESKVGQDAPPHGGRGGGGGRGRGGRGRGRGRGRSRWLKTVDTVVFFAVLTSEIKLFLLRRGGAGSGDDDDQDWKYDFDAPDVADLVKDHKPNFVKAPKRCFEKTEGYYSDQEGDDDAGEGVTELEGQSDSANMEEGDKSQEDEEEENQDEESRKEAEKSMDTDDNLRKRDGGHNTVVDSFKKVTRAEWSKMTYKEKKKYLKERRMWKNRNTVFIKDDSDNEQLTDDEKEEDLQFSEDSEDEKEKVRDWSH